jgi:hypothetical protein
VEIKDCDESISCAIIATHIPIDVVATIAISEMNMIANVPSTYKSGISSLAGGCSCGI